jgi:hypothetical protein
MRICEQDERFDSTGLKMICGGQCHVAPMAVSDNVNLSGSVFGLDPARQVSTCIHSGLMGVGSTPAELANFTILPKSPAQFAAEETPTAPPGIASVGQAAPPCVGIRSVNDVEDVAVACHARPSSAILPKAFRTFSGLWMKVITR